MLGQLVERFLTGEDRGPPDPQAVTATILAHAPGLHDLGITALWVFGSVAHGDAHTASDIDLLAEFDPNIPLSLVGLASLRSELSDLLGAKADLIEQSALNPAARETACRDAVRVL